MARSTIEAFFATAARCKTAVALRHRVDGSWQDLTWEGYAKVVRRAGRGLIALGVPAGGAVTIIGPNRPEWLIADFGALAAGAVPAPIYPTSTAEQMAYIVAHSEATVAILHDERQLAKLRAQKAEIPKLTRFVLMEGASSGDDVLGWEAFLSLGDTIPDADLDARLAAIDSKGLATLIYTSGTTGVPKAVMLSHGNLVAEVEATRGLLDLTEHDSLVSYLPLSHIAEQVLSLHGPAVLGCSVVCCEKLEQLADTLREVRPTVFFGVPRVWEKLQAKMTEAAAAAPPLRQKLLAWARGVGLRAGKAREEGRSRPLLFGVAKKLVFSKVAARLGLDRARVCASAAAPTARSTLDFFHSLDLPIYEVYGMSETSGATTVNHPGAFRMGTVGRTVPGAEIKLAADGEILMRGPMIFQGYYKDAAATAEALDSDGFLHSGDVGEFDAQGYLRITDRKKDLFKTVGGKYIAPQSLEALLKGIPGVGQAVVIGDGRKYCVALFTLDPESAARVAGGAARPVAELAADSGLLARFDEGVQRVNGGLAKYETIKKFKVLPSEFTVDSGELTPTMKIKRKVVNQRWAKEIDELYQ